MALGVTNNNTGIAQGGALTVEQVQRILVQPLEQTSVFLSSGVVVYDTNGSPVRLPKQAPSQAPLAFVGENEQIPEENPVFDEIELLPSSMKSVKIITRFSSELARQSVIALDAALQSRLVTDVAATLDSTLIASTVTDGTVPTGMLSYPGIQTLAVNGALSLDNVLDAWGALAAAFVDMSRIKLFMRSDSYLALRKIKQAVNFNTYAIGSEDASQGAGPNVLGIPVVLTNRIPITGTAGSHVTKAVLADMSQVAVARDLAPSVRVLTERYADFDQLALRTIARVDAKPVNPQAIVRLDGITAP